MLWNELAQRCSQPTLTTIAAKQLGKCKTWAIAKLPKQAISQFHDRMPCAVQFDLCLWPRSTIVLPRFAPFIRFDTVVPNRDQAARGDNSCQCSRTQRTFLEDLAGIHHLTTPHNSSTTKFPGPPNQSDIEWYYTLFPQWLTCECFWYFNVFINCIIIICM